MLEELISPIKYLLYGVLGLLGLYVLIVASVVIIGLFVVLRE